MSGKFRAADRQKFLSLRRQIMKALHDGGVPFALGSDAPQMWNVPGFSAHRELQVAGRRRASRRIQALQTGTVNVGSLLRHVVINGHDRRRQTRRPGAARRQSAEDIANTTKIAGVVVNGTMDVEGGY